VVRYEGGALVINLGRTEGFLPRSEQIPGESHHPGERIRCLVLDVREAPNQIKIVLSRSHPEFIRRLFELEVPEVAERIIEIRALAREAGYRTKIAVSSIDAKVDAVGACVGVRGSRIKNIVAELGGEKIDIVRWNESSQILISNALKPAEVSEIALCFELNRATVVVPEDQLSLAIGKRGQNVRLGARLTGWDVDILTPTEYNKGLDDMEQVLIGVEGLDNEKIEKMMALGIVSLADIEAIGSEPLVNLLGFTQELSEEVIRVSAEAAKRLSEEAEATKLMEQEAQASADTSTEGEASDQAPDHEAPTDVTEASEKQAEGSLEPAPTEPEDSEEASASPDASGVSEPASEKIETRETNRAVEPESP
jgi:N utilization substance protein A